MTRPLSTDDFAHPVFKPHGRVSHSLVDDVLVSEAEGPFNKEALESFANGLRTHLFESKTSPLLAWVATPEIEGYNIMMYQFESIFGGLGVQWKVFADKALALLWVRGELGF